MRKLQLLSIFYVSIFAFLPNKDIGKLNSSSHAFKFSKENIALSKLYTEKYSIAEIETIDNLLENNHGIKNFKDDYKKLVIANYLQFYEEVSEFELLEKRYKKGIDIIKLLNEKILSLNHHFAGLETYRNITSISNPHTYTEFRNVKEHIGKKMKKKFALNLPNFLDSNPFISTTFSLVGVMLGEGNQKKKEEDLNKIACIFF